ncbi:hypothetical protein AA313_de0202935 [Arthrobotrys entomopaga]|nr:hypothetical protein AA313_de0202935 [Arthrobotrys entomopaga]
MLIVFRSGPRARGNRRNQRFGFLQGPMYGSVDRFGTHLKIHIHSTISSLSDAQFFENQVSKAPRVRYGSWHDATSPLFITRSYSEARRIERWRLNRFSLKARERALWTVAAAAEA